jgi:hypothetical protein
LREQVEEAIEALGGAAFVRISTLSPKDAVKWQSEKLKGLLEAELEGAAAGDEDAEIIAINMACCLACRVTNGAEAMDLLIRRFFFLSCRTCAVPVADSLCETVTEWTGIWRREGKRKARN